jgi:hypothetical protein
VLPTWPTLQGSVPRTGAGLGFVGQEGLQLQGHCQSCDLVGMLATLLARLAPDPGVRGKQFELLCRWYLTTDPLYRRELKRVWLWDEWPGRWGADAGIDLVAEARGAPHLPSIRCRTGDQQLNNPSLPSPSRLYHFPPPAPSYPIRCRTGSSPRITGRSPSRSAENEPYP